MEDVDMKIARLRDELFSSTFEKIGFRVVLTGVAWVILGEVMVSLALVYVGIFAAFLGFYIRVAACRTVHRRTFMQEVEENVCLVAIRRGLPAIFSNPLGNGLWRGLLLFAANWVAWMATFLSAISLERLGDILEAKFLVRRARRHA